MELKRDATVKRHRLEPLAIKAVDDTGHIEGYGSVFGVVDAYREVVVAGAFQESIQERKASGRVLPMLWQHRAAEPIGPWDVFREDEKGLWVEGTLLKDTVSQAREAHALARAGVVSGLSIGYYVLDDSYNEKERILYLKKISLEEISLVTFPANEEARIETVKRKLALGQLGYREMRDVLRERCGLTKAQAERLLDLGFPGLCGNGGGDDHQAIARAIQGVSAQLSKPLNLSRG
jgi:HK97 family phage prohead protease